MIDIADKTRQLMPWLHDKFASLCKVSSRDSSGYPVKATQLIGDRIVAMLGSVGITHIERFDFTDASPVILGEISAPAGAPTVFLYACYDVPGHGVDLQRESARQSSRTEPSPADMVGGASKILTHLGALRVWSGAPPVGIRVVFEGRNDHSSPFDSYRLFPPELSETDVMVITDSVRIKPNTPVLTVVSRGSTDIVVEAVLQPERVQAVEADSAQPDALVELMRALSSVYDETGKAAVDGWRRQVDDARADTGSATKWGRKSMAGSPPHDGFEPVEPWITVVKLEAPRVNTAVRHAHAVLDLQVPTGQDPINAECAFIEHLERFHSPNVTLTVRRGYGRPYTSLNGAAYRAMYEAVTASWGREPLALESGRPHRMANAFAVASPGAEILAMGLEHDDSLTWQDNNQTLVSRIEKAVCAEASFFNLFAQAHSTVT